jgi:predicted transcriptional regulator
MSKPITLSVVVTQELRDCLERWAAADDRSMSYILRDILKQECDRRRSQQSPDRNTADSGDL